MVKVENRTDLGNENFIGYCIDLLEDILNNTDKFTYDLYLADEFGRKNADGSWTGMIGDLQKNVSYFNCTTALPWPELTQ